MYKRQELRQANERLRELDRMKDDFISTVTHELRTPLTSIRAFSEMLHEDPKIDLAQRSRFLGIIVSETVRLSRLINQILDLAKLESGRAEWTVAKVDVSEVIREAADSLTAALGSVRSLDVIRICSTLSPWRSTAFVSMKPAKRPSPPPPARER